MSTASIQKVNGHPVAEPRVTEPRFDPVALAEAEAIRTRVEAEAEAARIKAEGEAKAAEIKAAEEAKKLQLANERAAMRNEKDAATHAAYLAKKAAEQAEADARREKAEKAAAEQEAAEAQTLAEQQRTERMWKWGARGIYAVGLIIAAPVQFQHFWDPARKFLVAAPVLLEGLALVLACGAMWAVAHRRDVAPYRIGIMISALIAAAINLHGGINDPAIGLNAGILGAIGSLGGPIVLMAYEHGIAEQADGIPSRRERRAARRAKAEADAAAKRAREEKAQAAHAAELEKHAARKAAEDEQKRKDADRQTAHESVWKVADSIRAARGLPYVTDALWSEVWFLETGSKLVGITAEIETRSKVARTRMKTATDTPIIGEFSLVDSQKAPRAKKDPDAPDGRRFNGGTPPRRTKGDTQPYTPLAKKQAAIEQAAATTSEESK